MYQWIPETEAKTKAQKTCLRLSQSKEILFLILLCCLITSLYLQHTVFSSRSSTNMCSICLWEVQVAEESVHLCHSKESQVFSSSCLALFITQSFRLNPAIRFVFLMLWLKAYDQSPPTYMLNGSQGSLGKDGKSRPFWRALCLKMMVYHSTPNGLSESCKSFYIQADPLLHRK